MKKQSLLSYLVDNKNDIIEWWKEVNFFLSFAAATLIIVTAIGTAIFILLLMLIPDTDIACLTSSILCIIIFTIIAPIAFLVWTYFFDI